MVEVREGWLWKFDKWVIDTEKEYIYEPLREKLLSNIGSGLKSIGIALWDMFIPLLPDLIGYGAIATGAIVILSSMAGRGLVKPLAVFSGVTILAVCILDAN